MHYVYIIQSLRDKGLYIGYTKDLKKRFMQHQNKQSPATKNRSPWRVVHYQGFISEKDAISCEKYLKTTRGWSRIKRMLEDTLK